MALFKISKGTKSNLDNQTLTEGYCWFTPEDGKFYIDAFKNEVLTRIPLNAAMADSVAWTNVTGRPGTATSTKGGILTDTQAVKLAGIATGAEVNQNAFSNIKIGSTTVAADAKTDTVEFTGSNITISGDATNDKVTFSLTKANVTTALGYTPPTTNTTYDVATQSASGLMSSDDKTKLNGIATGAEVNQNAFSNIKVGSTTVAADAKTDTVEFVGSNVTITPDATNDKVTFSLTSSNVTTALGYTPPQQDTTYSAATQSAAGLMSAADKKKLDGVATGAQVNVIESVSASGTAPLTLSASTNNKAVSITGSVADASTSAKGVVKLDATTLNTWINQLSTGSSTPVDADYYISQYVGGGTSTTTYHRRPMSALWSYISGKISAAGYAKTANVVTNVAWDGTNKKLTKTIGSTTSDVVTASTLKTDLGLSSAMLFMGTLGEGGTISTLPSASTANQGYTYKVIVAGTYANLVAKIGDVFVSNGSSWVLIPSGDEPSGTVTSVGVSNATNGGLTVTSSPITTSGTISIGHTNVLTNAQTTQALYPIKIDKNGHISAYGTAVTSLPASDVSAWAKASTKPSYALSEITGAEDVQAIEGLTGTSGLLKKTAANTWTLDTTAYTTNTGTVTKVIAGTGLAIGSTAQGNFTTSGTINHTNSVTAKTAAAQSAKTLTWGGTFTLYEEKYDTCGHITGVASYNMTMPSNPNTDIKQNITLATTSKAYLTGVTTAPTSTAQALTGVADTGVYLTTTAGEISAVRHSFNVSGTEKAYMIFNSTTNAIDFIFN